MAEADLRAVTDVLSALDWPAPEAAVRMPGHDATVWRVEVDSRVVAVRLLPARRSPDRELTALNTVARLGPVVPAVLATGQWDDQAVIVMSWCRGRPIGDLLTARHEAHATPAEAADRLGRIFGAEQARLHDLDIAHLDYQPFNVLTDGDSVTGIVDWTNFRAADVRLDLAHTQVVLEFAPALLTDLDPADLDAFVAAWPVGYRAHRPWPSPAQFAPFLAEAATTQAGEWSRRAAAGETTAAVAAAAQAVAERHRIG